MALITGGSAAIALGVVGGSSGAGAGVHHGALARPHPRSAPVLQAVPIVIPPAPSTTTTTTVVTGGSVGPGSPVPVNWRSHVIPAVVNGVPTNVTDPSVVATVLVHSLPLYASPGAAAPSGTLANPNYLGATDVLLVTGYQPGWIQAYVPRRPNESTAWVPSADVSLSLVRGHIVVSLGARQLTYYRDNTPVFSTPVAPGAPSSPTPTGSYFVAYMVTLTDPGDAYGPYAFGTSAFSNTYYSFDGGPGQVGIHGTNQPWVIGSYASHGCVRLPNAAITTLAGMVVPGTPVEIES